MRRIRVLGLALALVILALAVPARVEATDGYFPIGYGVTAEGMAGAATAVTGDAFGGANNPATMVWGGEQLNIGVEWFQPRRSGARYGANFPTINGKVDSGNDAFFDDTNNFFIPSIGYNHMLGNDLSIGVTAYGNGGMDTDYDRTNFNFGHGPANLLGGNGKLGVDLMQLIVAPTLSWRFAHNQSIGLSPLLAYQRFKADGLGAFAPYSVDPSNLTNRGYDDSFGVGVRLGYYIQLTPWLSAGAAWSSRVSMSRLTKYSGLFAQHGSFDLPENYNVGIAVRPDNDWLLALDYQHIAYSQVHSVGDPLSKLMQGNLLGSDNGPGFGWHDVDAIKFGVQYKVSKQWTVRAGYAHCNNPVTPDNVTINLIAPGVTSDHMTLGVSYNIGHDQTLTGAYVHEFQNPLSGPSFFNTPGQITGATETAQMYQDSFAVEYSTKL